MASQYNIIWKNFRHLKGRIPHKKRSNEMIGVVMKHGINAKTCTVLVRWKTYFKRAGIYVGSTSRYQVHDEEEFARAGDLVVIKACPKVSSKKGFYIRNVVNQVGKPDYWVDLDNENKGELEDLIKKNYTVLKTEYVEEADRRKTKMKKRHVDLKKLKMRAIQKAYEDIRSEL